MIEVRECSKAFGQTKAVNQATLDIGDREVFGLVGSNGAGKSTLLRMMAGIIRPDQGEILIDDLPVYENEEAKKLFFYISDDSYFPPNYTAVDMVRFYRNFYPEFRIKLFHELMDQFHLEKEAADFLIFQGNEEAASCDHRRLVPAPNIFFAMRPSTVLIR